MKKIIFVMIAAQYLGCAPDHSQAGNSAKDAALSCQAPSGANAKASLQVSANLNMNINATSLNQSVLSADAIQYNQFIVKYKSNTQTAQSLAPSGAPVREYKVKGITFKNVTNETYTFSINNSVEEKQQILAELSSHPDVEYIEPDYPIRVTGNEQSLVNSLQVSSTSSDDNLEAAQFSDQWALPKVNLQAAWSVTKGSEDIVIAVLDSGIDYTHNDLKNNIWRNPKEVLNGIDDDANGFVDDIYGWNFANNNADPKTSSTSNHGTHVAGIIGGNRGNGQGVLGIAPHVKMMALKFIGENGSGSTSAAIQGIDYAISKKVFAINNSWGGSAGSKSLSDAISRAQKAGVLFVVAAGNGDSNGGINIDQQGWYPASFKLSNVLNVAATGSSDTLTSFSNYGATKVDVAAPGLNILSTVSDQGYQKMSGTSMAAPLVTGLAVLVKAANPALTAAQVIRVIQSSVDRLPSLAGRVISGGRVNALRAVQYAVANIGKAVAGGEIVNPCQ